MDEFASPQIQPYMIGCPVAAISEKDEIATLKELTRYIPASPVQEGAAVGQGDRRDIGVYPENQA